jgi:4-hydroxy-3-methylbut-2-enyl diphosphate reductase
MAAMVAIVSGAANDGRSVVIVGDEKHPEVVALVSAAREGRCFVVNSVDDLRRLPPNQHRALVIAQSTIGEEFFATLADKISATWADTEIRNTICSSSRARQRAIIDLSRRVRAIVVVGGSHSNNTTTLVAVARATGLPVFRVETVVDLPIDELREFETVGVATGASTAEETAAEVIATLHGL